MEWFDRRRLKMRSNGVIMPDLKKTTLLSILSKLYANIYGFTFSLTFINIAESVSDFCM